MEMRHLQTTPSPMLPGGKRNQRTFRTADPHLNDIVSSVRRSLTKPNAYTRWLIACAPLQLQEKPQFLTPRPTTKEAVQMTVNMATEERGQNPPLKSASIVVSTPTAHHIFSCTVVAQTCQSVQSHIDPMHLHGSSHEAHCLRFAQKHSLFFLIAQCRTHCRT